MSLAEEGPRWWASEEYDQLLEEFVPAGHTFGFFTQAVATAAQTCPMQPCHVIPVTNPRVIQELIDEVNRHQESYTWP